MKVKPYKTWIWDWNGTLLNDVDLALGVVNEILARHKVDPLSLDRYRDIFDFPVQTYYERAGLNLDQVDLASLSKQFCSTFEDRLHLAGLFPSVSDILTWINRQGSRQFLLSGTEHQALSRMVARYELDGVFTAIQGAADELARGKLALARKLCREFDVLRHETVLVGDTAHDADIAAALRMDCLLVCSGHHARARLIGLGYPVYESVDHLASELDFS